MKGRLFFVLVLISVLSFSQDTIFIDPTFLGTSNGTITNPYKGWRDFTWTGTEVFLQKRGTTYTGGTIAPQGDNIKLGAYGVGAKPKILNNSTGSTVKAIDFYQGDGITIENFDISSVNDITCGIAPGSNNNTILIDSCVIHDVGWGIRIFNTDGDVIIRNTEIYSTQDDGVYTENTKDMYIYNNHIHHVNDVDGGGDCIQIAREQRNLYVYDNILDHSSNGNKFCSIFGSAYTYRDSTPDTINFYNNICIGFKNDTFPTSGIYLKKSIGHLNVYNNDFISCATGIWQDASTSIYNNLFKNCSQAVTVTSNDTAYIANNIFMGNDIGIEASYSSYARGYNNVFIPGPATTRYYQEYSDVLFDYNVYMSNGTGYFTSYNTLAERQAAVGDEQNSFIDYAYFVDSTNSDYHILATSSLKDNGTSVSYRTIDRDGNLVPQGAGYDIGNYEYTDGYNPPDPICFDGVSITANISDDSNGGGTGSIVQSVSGGNVYTYSWSNSETTKDVYNLTTENYSVTITYNDTCDTTLTYFVDNIVDEEVSIGDSININWTSSGYEVEGFYSIYLDNDTHDFTFNDLPVQFIDADFSGISSPGSTSSDWGDVGRYYVYSNYSKDIYFTGLLSGYYNLSVLCSRSYYSDRWQLFSINDVLNDSIDAGGNSTLLNMDSIQPNANGDLKITIDESVLDQSGNIYLNGLSLKYLEPAVLDPCDTTNLIITGEIKPDTNNTQIAEIDVTVSGGLEPYSFLWDNDSTTEDLSNIGSNPSLSLTVTDNNGCTGNEIFEIPNIDYVEYNSVDSIMLNYTDSDYLDNDFYNITSIGDTHNFIISTDTAYFIDANWANISYPGSEGSSWGSVGKYCAYSNYSKHVKFDSLNPDSLYSIKLLSSRLYYSNKWQLYYVNNIFKDSVDAGGNSDIVTIEPICADDDGTIDIEIRESSLFPLGNVYVNGLVLSYFDGEAFAGDTIKWNIDTTFRQISIKINNALLYKEISDTIVLGEDTPVQWINKMNDLIKASPCAKNDTISRNDDFDAWVTKMNNVMDCIKP